MICPQCKYQNRDDARFCRICGTALREDDAEGSHASSLEPGLCPSCGHQNEPGAQYCASCGAAQDNGHEHRPTEYLTPTGNQPPALPRGGFTDIVSQSFSVYIEHFWPFFLISLLPQLVGGVISLPFFFTENISVLLLIAVPITIVQIVLSLLSVGAATYGVGRHFLGLPINVSNSYRFALAQLARLVGVFLLILLLIIPVFLLSLLLIYTPIASITLIVLPIFAFFAIAWLFVTHAVVIERRGSINSLTRSWDLVVKQKNWSLTFGYALGLVLVVAGIYILGLLVITALSSISEILAFPLTLAFGALVAPLLQIGLTVMYFYIRARSESYNHKQLAAELLHVAQ